MRNPLRVGAALVLLGLAGCAEPDGPAIRPSPPAPTAAVDTSRTDRRAVVAQTVYVPAYSHIYHQNDDREIDLTTTLSIRNTDPERPITVTGVRYHDSGGRLVRRYGEGGFVLAPLASRSFVVAERDRTGGVGANFLVDWQAGAVVSAPVVEAVMISTASTQGISFVSRGTVVRPLADAPAAPAP